MNICDIALCLRYEDHKRLMESAEALDYTTLTGFLMNPRMKIFNDSGDAYCLNLASIDWDESDKEIVFLRQFLDDHRHSFVRIGDDIANTEFEVLPEDDEGEDDTFYELINVESKIIPAPGFVKLKKRKAAETAN